MCEELIGMINNNSLSVRSFFTMAPYIAHVDTQYQNLANELNYFDDFNVVTDRTFLHLSKLVKVALDDSIKLLVLTGYQGTGKTNFLRFCEALIKNKTMLKGYRQVQDEIENLYSFWAANGTGISNDTPDIFDEDQIGRTQNEIATLRKSFTVSLKKIRDELSFEWYNRDLNELRNHIADYLNEHLQGTVIYFDFDAGKRDSETPLELKLTRQIEEHINQMDPATIKIFYQFYERNQTEITKAFENRFNYYVEEAIKLIYRHRRKQFSVYKHKFLDIAHNLDVDQLLCIEIFLVIAESLGRDLAPNDCIYYILDNIDMISGPNNTILIKTIGDFWNFIVEMQSLMHALSHKREGYADNQLWINAYVRFKYIFSMRETTSMHIGDHLRSRIKSYAEHIDISMDVNKGFIIKKRYDILKKYIDANQITNPAFIKIAQYIEQLTEDKFFKWTFFLLFNNDYRTVLDCLCELCKLRNSPVFTSFELLRQEKPYMKFGGRGIILKALCDAYRKWGYFDSLKVPAKGGIKTDYPFTVTLVRIILTVLSNLEQRKKQPDINDTNSEIPFFVMRETSVSLRQLYEKVAIFFGNTEEERENNFLVCIEAMFSARAWNYWSHLITFDNAPRYYRNDFLAALRDISGEKDIYVRCTKAGEQYLNILCIHYEFFSCRYAEPSRGLFSRQSITKMRHQYQFERQIKMVYTSVKRCCDEMGKLDKTLLDTLGYAEHIELLNSDYVTDHKFHEERIIHNHISYLDAFRLYLINGPLQRDTVSVNQILVGYISKYLNLLIYDKNAQAFYSDNSKLLYEELNKCIDYIVQRNYNDTATRIARDYYRTVISTIKDKS